MTIALPEASLARVLRRVDHIWHPESGGAPHHLVFGMSGSGKTTLIKHLLGKCADERVLIVDPKPNAADPAWDGPPDDPHQWGKPVTTISRMFGLQDSSGGGPYRKWFRIVGSPDRDDTARRFADALGIIRAEGHCILVLDDVRETCRQLRLSRHVDTIMSLSRSGNVGAILSTTETSWVEGRRQGGMVWVGHTSGLDAAKDGAKLLGWRGKDGQDMCAAIPQYEWIFNEEQPGNQGPVLVRG